MKGKCSEIYNKYHSLLNNLQEIVSITEMRVIKGEDLLFSADNVNFFFFFSRSYVVGLCTYLESYLTEMATEIFKRHCNNVNLCNVPKSFILASLNGWEVDKKTKDISKYMLSYEKKEISSFFEQNKISGNVKKTFNVFEVLGVDLSESIIDCGLKDQVASLVHKRNDIIHRNDNAINISFRDIIDNIRVVDEYIKLIRNCIIKLDYD